MSSISGRQRFPVVVAITSAVLILYGWRLSDTPVALHDAEVLFALHAKAIAHNLHDSNGRLLPLYFQMPQIGQNVWFHPVLVYFTALFLKVLPISEWTVRLPTVCVGLVSILWIYGIARRVLGSDAYGVVAAALIALTPAHFIHSRLAMDYLYPVPFVLAWFWCLVRFEESNKPSFVFFGTLALGAGVYSYIGALVVVPLYVAMTLALLIDKYRSVHWSMVWAALGVVLPLVPLLVWLPRHSGVFADTISRYESSSAGVLHALRSLLSSARLQEGLNSYWTLSSPGYLFFAGSSNWVDSTRYAGVFLLPMSVFMIAGAADFIIGPRSRVSWLTIAGLLTAPLGAIFVGEPWAIQRELELVPFAVLLATFGVRRLWQSTDRLWRWVAIVALASMPLQFIAFYADYFSSYRLNSLGWFGPPFGGAVSRVLESEANNRRAPRVFLSRAIPYGREHWQFQLAKVHREDLLASTDYFDPQTEVAMMPVGSIIVEGLADGRPLDPNATSPMLEKIATVTKADGGPALWILRR